MNPARPENHQPQPRKPMTTSHRHLQIHIHKTDGSTAVFVQEEENLARQFLGEFRPDHLFTQYQLLFADDRSLACFPVGRVVRMDLVGEWLSHGPLPPGTVKAVELTGTEFQALSRNPELRDQWNQARTQEDSLIVFYEVEMAGHPPLFLVMEIAGERLVDQAEGFLSPFAAPALCFRMRNGGVAVLNLAHLAGVTCFPGPQPTPMAAWPARRRPQPEPAPASRRSPNPLENWLLFSQVRPADGPSLDLLRRNQNENVTTMEREH